MKTLVAIGWVSGVEQPVSCIKVIREYTGMSLSTAKSTFEELLVQRAIPFELPDAAEVEFLSKVRACGYDCKFVNGS
jgi:ribosomal protein L7/L12